MDTLHDEMVQKVRSKAELLISLKRGFNPESGICEEACGRKQIIYQKGESQKWEGKQEEEWKTQLAQWKLTRQKDVVDIRQAENIDNTQLNMTNSVLYILQSKVGSPRIEMYLKMLQQQGVARIKGLSVFLDNVVQLNECPVKSRMGSLVQEQLLFLYKSLRSEEARLFSLREGLEQVGEQIHHRLDQLYQRLLTVLVTQLKDLEYKDRDERRILLEGLRWKYHGRDYQSLLHLDLFSVLEHQLEKVQLFLQENISLDGIEKTEEQQVTMNVDHLTNLVQMMVVQSLAKQHRLDQAPEETSQHSSHLRLRKQRTVSKESTIDDLLTQAYATIFA